MNPIALADILENDIEPYTPDDAVLLVKAAAVIRELYKENGLLKYSIGCDGETAHQIWKGLGLLDEQS
jgi:hypothetical protein